MKTFTKSQLAEHNGQAGQPAYVAHNGIVYDVSTSKMWKNGQHMRRHQAGQDLTADIQAAPHPTDHLLRFPQVGTLEKQPQAQRPMPTWLNWLLAGNPFLRRHPHPMTVHFPIAFIMANPFFNLLFRVTGRSGFETTAYHCLWFGILTMVAAMATGFFTWWYNYEAKMMKAVAIKITFSLITLVIASVLFFWHVRVPDVLTAASNALYLVLSLLLVPLISIVGWYGATLTFPLEEK